MKRVFNFCKIFPGFLVIFYTFPSCKSSSTATGNPYEEKKRRIIKIVNTAIPKLVMIDERGRPADTFVVWPGQCIKWKISTPEVKSFKGMPGKKLESHSIFRREPHKKFLSKNWKAKITKTDNKEVVDYFYNINWIDNTGSPHTYDPLIQVKPQK